MTITVADLINLIADEHNQMIRIYSLQHEGIVYQGYAEQTPYGLAEKEVIFIDNIGKDGYIEMNV